ncbi:MAG TPA: hypothetical protein DEP35_03520 [Deltaproteobacteria bacterium]|nr:hypothetical protein [Deltaproteobacteria bacterium]
MLSSEIPVAWMLLNVGIIQILYLAIFSPYGIGWASAYIFSGIAVAAAFLAAFELALWPVNDEPELRHSLAKCLRETRLRLELIGRAWLATPGEPLAAVPALQSKLGAHLKLLDGVKSEHRDERRTARLLGEISQVERIAFATERLALIAKVPGSHALHGELRNQVQDSLRTGGEAIEEFARRIEGESYAPFVGVSTAGLRASLSELTAAKERALLRPVPATTDESSVSALIAGLEQLGDVVEAPVDVPPADTLGPPAPRSLSARLGPDAMRYGVKVGLAAVLGLLIGLFANRPNLAVILWTVMIASLPGYGATVRKMGLRLIGALTGGLITLGVLIVVSASYDSLLAYLVVVFCVTWLGSYVAQSSERLSYAGIQLTNTFLILYIALEPKASEYDPLWRFWGIVLGTLSLALVELVVWPEHTGPRLRAALGRATRMASALWPGVLPAPPPQLRRAEIDLIVVLRHATGLADEARLEGTKTGVDPAAALAATETLRRIAYRLIGLALPSRMALSPEVDALRSRIVHAINGRLAALAGRIDPSTEQVAAVGVEELDLSLRRLRERQLTAPESAQAESCERLAVLVHDLERTFAGLVAT